MNTKSLAILALGISVGLILSFTLPFFIQIFSTTKTSNNNVCTLTVIDPLEGTNKTINFHSMNCRGNLGTVYQINQGNWTLAKQTAKK